jgi:hypothetical protein
MEARKEHGTPQNPVLDIPEPLQQLLDTPSSAYRDPSYEPPETLRSKGELRTTRPVPPITKSRARIQTQEKVTEI